jgi:hypothetical protein
MIIAGIILLVSGYFIYTSNEKIAGYHDEIENLIQAVIVDGVFTDKEKDLIEKVAEKYSVDKQQILTQVKKRLEASGADAETEIINQSKKKGDDFEKFIIKKFNSKYFTIKQWAGDKYVDGLYSEKTQQPDIIVQFQYNNYKRTIAIECKWRQDYYNGGVEIAYDSQLKRYKNFTKTEKIKVYIALGIGGKAGVSDVLYLIPLKDLQESFITIEQLKPYIINCENDFYFNIKKGRLEITE